MTSESLATASPVRRSRRALLIALTVLITAIASLAALELIARAHGGHPRHHVHPPESAIHTPDPVLGWKMMPGEYQLAASPASGEKVRVTVWPDGTRATGPKPSASDKQVVLVGCSFTMGWGVADDQTWAWRVQALRPDLQVVNHGVAGYGTLQSLLVLEQLLNSGAPPPARVIYGFIDHGVRNVATPQWLAALALSDRPAAVPYCTVNLDDELECHPPEAYPALPLHQYLAFVAQLENRLVWSEAGPRQNMAVRVTKLLIDRMATLCREHGVPFSVAVLYAPELVQKTYVPNMERHHIDVIDCNQPRFTADDLVVGDLHPNGRVHQRWADCIVAALAQPTRLPPPW
jgi:hypothetical protein